MKRVDVIVVTYNSAELIRGCVEPLARLADVRVIVVDNDSPDRSLEAISDLDVAAIPMGENAGFARACNRGWREGEAPYVLFLNPDARVEEESLRRLVSLLETDSRIGVLGPKTLDFDGSIVHSQRRYLDLLSVWAQAVLLHHLLPLAAWTDGVIRDPAAYASPQSPDWISGAALMLRRSTLEELDGFDERFFMYCEDQDLCRRVRQLGKRVHFEPSAVARHAGGASAPRGALFHVLVASRRAYLSKYVGPIGLEVARAGLALGELVRIVVTRGGLEDRRGHVRGLRAALAREPAFAR